MILTEVYTSEMSALKLKSSIDKLMVGIKIDTGHDIPYTAGYSKSGDTVFIDRNMPKSLVLKNGKSIDVWKYLIAHEIIEKSLLKTNKLRYEDAHQIALRVERSFVEGDGIAWSEYDSLMQKHIVDIRNRQDYSNVPKNLDTTPYIDDQDFDLLNLMGIAYNASK